MAVIPLLVVMALVVVVASAAVALLYRFRAGLPVAHVNERTLHQGAIVRVGGVALWLGFTPAGLLLPAPAWFTPSLWLGGWALVLAVSLRDDVRSVGVPARLAVHLVATAWFAVGLHGALGVSWWEAALAFLATAWALNLYNFMDGSDGLAIGMTVAGFGAMGALLALAGGAPGLPWAVVAAAVPLLAVNLPPARMFLGDVGAVPLGFLAGSLGCAGIAAGAWPWWFPLLAFLPFVADATVTLARRVLRGERFWQSHRAHHYQRLHRLGAGHRGTLALYGGLMAGCAVTAVACAHLAPQAGPWALAAWCTVHALLFASIDYHWRRSAPPT